MSSERRKYTVNVWEAESLVYGQVMLHFNEWGTLTNRFRDSLIENVKNLQNFELLKDEGYPTESDSNYILFRKDNYDKGQALLKKFREKYPSAVVHPGLLHFLFKTKKYRQWKEKVTIREAEEKQLWEAIDSLFLFEVSTNHDYPEVCIRAKIFNKEALINELQKVAVDLKIELDVVHSVPKK